MRPGTYHYFDAPGAPSVLVKVWYDEGILVCTFPPSEGDEGATLVVNDMAGKFEGPIPERGEM